MDQFVGLMGDLGPYLRALSWWPAGRIELLRGEDPSTVELMLRRAASLRGLCIRSGWEPGAEAVLYWSRL